MWLGAGELVMVGILALLVFGPEKLPELARQLARIVQQLQGMVAEVRRNVDEVINEQPPVAQPPELPAVKAEPPPAPASSVQDAELDATQAGQPGADPSPSATRPTAATEGRPASEHESAEQAHADAEHKRDAEALASNLTAPAARPPRESN